MMKNEPIWNLMSLFCRAHPWHGVDIGPEAPKIVNCYIEIVPTDTVKFELDKKTGLLRADRPQKYSNSCPSLYGLIPQTHCGPRVGAFCAEKAQREKIEGDGDPLDICVLTEKPILRGDILLKAIPIGGFRAIDGKEADDKIIAVLEDDLVYTDIHDIKDCPINLIDRLKHYFLTYKDSPDSLRDPTHKHMEIVEVYGAEEAQQVIELARQDYEDHFTGIRTILKLKL